jgi:putative nucleotide binding protein
MEINQDLKSKEEFAIVLDFLPNGYSNDDRPMFKKTPIVQAIGKNNFTLLELVPKKDVFLQPSEEVYIGDKERDKIHHINGRLVLNRLSPTAKAEIEPLVSKIVRENQPKFVEFFNKAQPLSTRMHSLELLPGLGKKHMWQILEERRGEPFKDFADLKDRVKLMPDPEKIIIKRILKELEREEKHYIFLD